MNTKNEVQSYLQDEVLDLVLDHEALDAWHEMVRDLGLEGQTKIAEPKKSPIPYLFMVPSMVATFETLCPREVELKDYSAGAIPLKALELIGLAQREGHFDRIMIRYDDKSPDPVAIGEKCSFYGGEPWHKLTADELKEARAAGKNPYASPEQRYLIARWGAESASLDVLAQTAKDRWIREKGAEESKKIKDAQAVLNTLAEDATIKFNC